MDAEKKLNYRVIGCGEGVRNEEDEARQAAAPAVVRCGWPYGLDGLGPEHLDEDVHAGLLCPAVLKEGTGPRPHLLQQPARSRDGLKGAWG
jgi:hypothetical protein